MKLSSPTSPQLAEGSVGEPDATLEGGYDENIGQQPRATEQISPHPRGVAVWPSPNSTTEHEAAELRRECAYLKQRNAQLQGDVTDLSAEVERLRRALERTASRQTTHVPNPLGSGQ